MRKSIHPIAPLYHRSPIFIITTFAVIICLPMPGARRSLFAWAAPTPRAARHLRRNAAFPMPTRDRARAPPSTFETFSTVSSSHAFHLITRVPTPLFISSLIHFVRLAHVSKAWVFRTRRSWPSSGLTLSAVVTPIAVDIGAPGRSRRILFQTNTFVSLSKRDGRPS